MKSELKAKFLQTLLNKKDSNKGFTLVELLVVIIIVGILSAIALPSFLNQAAKAKQSEAKSNVGAVNRTQLGYRVAEGEFASTLEDLGAGVPNTTIDYNYEIAAADTEQTTFTALPNDSITLRSYAGGVGIVTAASDIKGQAGSGACQTTEPSGTAPAVTYDNAATKVEQIMTCATEKNVMR